MDGTLYTMNEVNNIYKGSLLEANILKNCINFVAKKENISVEKASEIVHDFYKDDENLSVFLSQRYNISRQEYFENVWDVHPENIFAKKDVADIVYAVKENVEKIVLISSSPKIWVYRVLKYLDVFDKFERIYTAEDALAKADIYRSYIGKFKPSEMLSVGDQYHSDIAPAREMGMNAIQVFRIREDLERALDFVRQENTEQEFKNE